jgi:uncharacterized protein
MISSLTGLGTELGTGLRTGLFGGVIVVPLLPLVFGVDVRYAIGALPVSGNAASSGAAAAYVREGFFNIRTGMFLDVAAILGAPVGAAIAAKISPAAIAVIFGST